MTGVWPVAPTVFDDTGELDLDGQRRVTDFLVDSGVAGICVLANYSEQFSLNDEERRRVQDDTLEHLDGRLPAIVTISHFSARITAQRAREAAAAGAAMLMVMPPFFGATMSYSPAVVREWMLEVAAATDLPLMLQDAPLSTTPLSATQIADLAREVPSLRYAKIETARAAETIRTLRSLVPEDLPGVFDGEEGVTLIPDLDAGAVGAMTSCTVPEVMAAIVDAYSSGDRGSAVRLWHGVLPLVHYENRLCGLIATKVLLQEGGVIASAFTRSPLLPLSKEATEGLMELARERDVLALRWAR
ncbi:dihydrodipicolinate synthase family protein [Micromonospora sp. NPDC005206]|uniref:dihydrodipicolinate synthase family protein n=1 Tax=Micromonospora sp. NPDC005206 TaxID=3157022 RepID=UPI0033A7E966